MKEITREPAQSYMDGSRGIGPCLGVSSITPSWDERLGTLITGGGSLNVSKDGAAQCSRSPRWYLLSENLRVQAMAIGSPAFAGRTIFAAPPYYRWTSCQYVACVVVVLLAQPLITWFKSTAYCEVRCFFVTVTFPLRR